jgi:leucyl aminopeptidase (aminopeptidase T)
MPEIPAAALLHAAKILLAAPVRGASSTARFVEQGSELAILTDEPASRIGKALQLAAQQAEAKATLIVLERPPERPLRALPPEARMALASAESVVFAASAPNAERSMRETLAAVVKARGMRYARLPDITEAAFARGLQLDYRAVGEAGKAVARRVEGAQVLEVTSPAGTSLRIGVTPGAWVGRLGEIVPGTTVGFPAGALFTSPESIEGTFVADASLGEFFGIREGLLIAAPVRFEIKAGRVTAFYAPHSQALEADVRALLGFAENSNRIGLVVLGVNAGIDGPTGDSSVDQHLPGLHLGLGDPGGKSTAVAWKARTAFAACQVASRVIVDGRVVFDGGKLVELG